jgi:hypothetical protein
MGMFDELWYEREMYQTKDTPQQSLDTYEIRGDELWWKKTEYEWAEDKESMFGGYMREVSHEWKFCKDFDGLIRFYREDKDNGGYKNNAWIEYKALFMDGKIIKFEQNQ